MKRVTSSMGLKNSREPVVLAIGDAVVGGLPEPWCWEQCG